MDPIVWVWLAAIAALGLLALIAYIAFKESSKDLED